MTIASRMKQRRKALGLTQLELANSIGISQQSIESIENGRTHKPRNILELAKALQCNPEWLLNGKNIIPLAEITSNSKSIPLLNYMQAACYKEKDLTTDETNNYEYTLVNDSVSDNSFALHIEGDSMKPEFEEGDLVVIDTAIKPTPGEFVFAKNSNNAGTFKKFRPLGVGVNDFELVPLNTDYPILRASEHNMHIVGVMVEHRIYRRKR
ncbi:LexA family protein [Arsenophonus endosymbiont of Crataerina pallida]|uniref:LexA family protein n=1 Tax=Arsenophonus endosymbiont of Crataerina pallida TaxID=3066235 RepID=UPI0030CB9295